MPAPARRDLGGRRHNTRIESALTDGSDRCSLCGAFLHIIHCLRARGAARSDRPAPAADPHRPGISILVISVRGEPLELGRSGDRGARWMPAPARRDLGGRRHNTPIESAQLMGVPPLLSVRSEPTKSDADNAATEFIKRGRNSAGMPSQMSQMVTVRHVRDARRH